MDDCCKFIRQRHASNHLTTTEKINLSCYANIFFSSQEVSATYSLPTPQCTEFSCYYPGGLQNLLTSNEKTNKFAYFRSY